MYRAIAGIWRGQRAVSVDPASLRPPSQQIDLQMLAVEEAHLQALAGIEARKRLEVGRALGGVQTALRALPVVRASPSAEAGVSTEPIETTLRAAAAAHDRERLFQASLALHLAASAVAQVESAAALADLR